MATGSPGTNGVWQYGEDDSEATFSALLNKAAGTTDTQIGLDRARLTTLEARKIAGLVPAVPSSVDKTGGTATANSLGVVAFSGVSSVSLNSVFTSEYRNYRIMINFTGFTANNDLFMRLRKAGTDSAVSYTYAGNVVSTASSTGTWVANNQLFFHLSSNFSTYANRSRNFVEVFGPAESIFTNVFWNSFHDNGTVWNHTTVSGCHTVTNTYDGVTLYPSSGTISGYVQVFGYND